MYCNSILIESLHCGFEHSWFKASNDLTVSKCAEKNCPQFAHGASLASSITLRSLVVLLLYFEREELKSLKTSKVGMH